MIPSVCLCSTRESLHDLPMIRCGCGVLRQEVAMTEEDYRRWYERRYFDGIYTHTYQHDSQVAEMRLDAYGLEAGMKLLDVGCGNAAFVNAAVARGLDAWGQDLAVQSDGPRVYIGPLEKICFANGAFDVVTMHDVLEHVPEPRALLGEVRRILKPSGRLIVDFPRFFHPAGEHHWKAVEHLWMLSEAQLQQLLESEGFGTGRHPIPSKCVVYATSCEVTP